MAIAGDGKPRSERRCRTRVISIRVTADEQQRLRRRAREAGSPTLSGWIIDRLSAKPSLTHRQVIQTVAWIGRIGSTLADLVDAVEVMASPDGAACLAQLQSDAAHLQQLLMGTSLDAGQGHP